MSQSSAFGRDILHVPAATAGRPAAGLLYDSERCGRAPPWHLLDPQTYGASAHAITARGGRGAAWFVSAAFGAGALRHYRRGGLMGRINAAHYLWLGVERARCTREYRLLRALHEQGLPVPAPIAAGWWRSGLCYRQALLTERIAQAESLAQMLARDATRTPWEAVGQTLARFHRAGVWHADLNAHNILRDARGEIWLIDFDRCTQSTPRRQHQEQNLARLRRSLQKLGAEAGEAGWQRVYTAWLIAMNPNQTLPG